MAENKQKMNECKCDLQRQFPDNPPLAALLLMISELVNFPRI